MSLLALSAFESLPVDRQEKLAELLDACLQRLERGERCDTDELLRQHPDLAEPLAAFLQSLSFLHLAVRETPIPASPPPASESCSEQRLGDYRLLRKLGRGGMGVVYEATQLSLGRRVALKVLPFAAVLDERQIARFHNEALAAAQLHHNHIVPVYAVGCERGVHYYSMQLIDGQPLDQVMNDVRSALRADALSQVESAQRVADQLAGAGSAAMPPVAASARLETVAGFSTLRTIRSRPYVRSIVELGIHAAEALDYAHSCGVVHRDIKPSNLLLDRRGKLWITDFGLARVNAGSDLTQAGELLGTVRYMSPEQASGQTALIDHRTDIYSLGVTLYELLTLKPLFDGADRQQVIRQIERAEPASPQALNPSVGSDLATIICKAMSKSREDRYQTAQQLADDLRRYLDGRPTLARRSTLLDHTARYVVRHARWCVAVTMLLLLALAGITTATLMIAHKKVQVEAARQRAELHLQTAQRVVDRFNSEIARRLEQVPGAEEVRASLLREALAYYQSFTRYAANDVALREDVAHTHLKMASLHDRLGQTAAALDAYDHARFAFLQLSQRHGSPLVHRANAALCENNRGVLLVQLGRYAEARQAYALALQEQDALLAEQPGGRRLICDMALTHLNLGRLQGQVGRLAEARASLTTAESLLGRLANEAASSRDIQLNRATVLNALVALPTETPASRREHLQQAIDIDTQLLAAGPYDAELRHLLALAYNNLGTTLHQQRRVPVEIGAVDAASTREVDVAYERAVAIQSELVQQAPLAVQYRAELATTWNNLGQWRLDCGRGSEAEEALIRSKCLLEPLCDEHPEHVLNRSSLGGVLNNLALVYERQGRLDEAAAALQAAIVHQQFALEKAPRSDRYREFLRQHRENLLRVIRGRAQDGNAAAVPTPRDARASG